MRIYKETILGVAAVFLLAMAAPVAMADGEDCCNDPNSQHAEKIDTSIRVNEIDSILMKLKVVENSDVANDGRLLLDGTAHQMALQAWYFDRNGEADVEATSLTIVVKDSADQQVALTDAKVSFPTDTVAMDGFLPVNYEFTLPTDLSAGIYTIEVPNGDTPFTTKFALYEVVHWVVDAGAGVTFPAIDPTAEGIESSTFTVTNKATSTFHVDVSMADLVLKDGTAEIARIAVANNVEVLTSDDGTTFQSVKTLDDDGKAAAVATLETTTETDGSVIEDTTTIKFKLLDATPGDNANSILPDGVYQGTFCVLVTASVAGDHAYKQDGAYEYDGEAPTTAHTVTPNGESGPDGKGKVTPPSDY